METTRPPQPAPPPANAAQQLQRASLTKPQEPRRSCIICCDEDLHELVRPCRSCPTDYCKYCLKDMFTSAVEDPTRMPPRCCTFLQIHAATLTDEEADTYRKKLEEWMTKEKTYCPAPACSTFIPPRLVPTISTGCITLQSLLKDVMAKIKKDPASRFFRGEMKNMTLPGDSIIPSKDIDLTRIDQKLDKYKSAAELTRDFTQMITNAQQYHGPQHPVARTAAKFLAVYVGELSAVTDELVRAASEAGPVDHLLCPKCRVGICIHCHQIYHDGPCDLSRSEHEAAMLSQFGCKQCPLCKQATKKMFGCSHMLCICGCHWCWGCVRPISECDGGCADEDEEDDYDSEEGEEDFPGVLANPPAPSEATGPTDQKAEVKTDDIATSSLPPFTQTQAHRDLPLRIKNLDAGGGRRWAETDLDFGEEPGEENFAPIWYCHHKFCAYSVIEDSFNRGNLDAVECNRCFKNVIAERHLPGGPRKRRRSKGAAGSTGDVIKEVGNPAKAAWECRWCHLVVCVECRDFFKLQHGE